MHDPDLETQILWDPKQYSLLDFGDGRKLERFGQIVLDRPCPAAEESPRRDAGGWNSASIVLDERGKNQNAGPSPDDWTVSFDGLQFGLKLTPFGHVGLFPEQASNWEWLSARCQNPDEQRNALNLFGYTGGTTLLLAKRGANVAHIDASQPAVSWARDNAVRSGLEEASIRWIVDDARKFVARELRRGKQYDVIVLDPPSYGHGPRGQVWKIERDLYPLVLDCLNLLRVDSPSVLLLTAHSNSPNENDVETLLHDEFGKRSWDHQLRSGRLKLHDRARRQLDSGYFVRCQMRPVEK